MFFKFSIHSRSETTTNVFENTNFIRKSQYMHLYVLIEFNVKYSVSFDSKNPFADISFGLTSTNEVMGYTSKFIFSLAKGRPRKARFQILRNEETSWARGHGSFEVRRCEGDGKIISSPIFSNLLTSLRILLMKRKDNNWKQALSSFALTSIS